MFCGIVRGMAKEVGKASEAAEQNQALAAGQPQVVGTAPVLHKAELIENDEGATFRAPVGVHVSQLGHIVHGNFHGVLDTKEGKKRWRVLHGTPARGLPTAVLDEITRAEPTAIAPYTPPAADQVR